MANEKEEKRLFDALTKSPNSESLHIARLPVDLKNFLQDFANKHCCGDYGWALSVLLGPVTEFIHTFKQISDDQEARLMALERKLDKKEEVKPSSKEKQKRFIKEE